MGNKITLHIHHDFISAPPKQAASGRPPLSGCDVVSFPGGILRVFLGEITKKPCWLITYNLKHYGFLGYISYIELVHEVYKPRNQETRKRGFSCFRNSLPWSIWGVNWENHLQGEHPTTWGSSSVGMMKFPTEWKVIIHSCSKPPTSFHVKWRHVRMFAYVLQQSQSELSWCHVKSVHFFLSPGFVKKKCWCIPPRSGCWSSWLLNRRCPDRNMLI